MPLSTNLSTFNLRSSGKRQFFVSSNQDIIEQQWSSPKTKTSFSREDLILRQVSFFAWNKVKKWIYNLKNPAEIYIIVAKTLITKFFK